jgi:porin
MIMRSDASGLALAAALAALLGASSAMAQTPPAEPGPADDFWTARGLFDPRGGPRDVLRSWGIDVNGRITHFYQGITAGDGRRMWQAGAKAEASVKVDAEKLGLWRGFSVNLQQEWNIGRDAIKLGSGVLLPVNTSMILPRIGGYENDTSINVTQTFGDSFSVSAGKFNMLTLAAGTPLAGGGGVDTFMNIGLAAPVSGVTPPYLIGAMATLKTQPAIFTLMVYDPRNAQDPEVLRRPFKDGVTTSLSMTIPTRLFFGLQGFYGVRGVYSTQEGFNLSELPALLLPPQSRGSLEKKGYSYGSISFQQNLWEDPSDPRRSWGVFFDGALSDGNPNPFFWHVITGVAGSVPLASRPLDRWGVGFFHYALSDDVKDGLARVGIRRRDETGVEAFYSLALTPWLRVSANVQWIRPTQPEKKDAMFTGLRTQVRF